MPRRVAWVLLIIFFSFKIDSFSQDFQEKLYSSYLKGDMNSWYSVISELEDQYKRSNDKDVLLNIVHTQYGLVGYLIGIKEYSKSKQIIAKAESNLAILLKLNPKMVEAISLKAAIIAYKIAINPYKAPFLGPESNELLNQSISLEPNNPIALIEKGNSKHYAPSFVGGDPNEAIMFYRKAIEILDKKSDKKQTRTWWYLNALAQLALAAEKAHKYDIASETYQRIIKIAPDFKWVREELYPKFLKKTK